MEEWYGHLNGGGVASVAMPLWYMGRFANYCPDLKGKIAIYQIPVWNKGDTRCVLQGGTGTGVTNQSAHPELAKEFLRFLYTDQSVLMFAEKANAVGATKDSIEMAKSYISESMYNMYSIFNEENVKSAVLSFDTQAQGSKVSLDDELWGPVADVVNGAMTADVWAENIENAFAQIRSELEAAQ